MLISVVRILVNCCWVGMGSDGQETRGGGVGSGGKDCSKLYREKRVKKGGEKREWPRLFEL